MGRSPPQIAYSRGQRVSEKWDLWLDEPLPLKMKMRRLRLSGWYFPKNGSRLTRIRCRVGKRTFYGRFDCEKSGITDSRSTPDGPRRCGFAVDVIVPFGRNPFELQVATADGKWQEAYARTVVGPLRVRAAEREHWQKIDEAEGQGRYAFFFSRPNDWNKPAQTLRVTGWCVDQTGDWIRDIRAVVGGRTFPGRYGIERPDVAAWIPHRPAARDSGFVLTAELPRGKQIIRLEAKGSDGIWRQFFVSEVIGGESPDDEPLTPDEIAHFEGFERRPRFRFWFDRPTDWSQPVRHLRVSGWCVATWGEEIRELRARIRGRTYKASYGILRPDVAAILESGAGALRSGFALDVAVPWGFATLILEARSGRGPWEQFFCARVRGSLLGLTRKNDSDEAVGNYAQWIRLYDRLTRKDTLRIRKQISAFSLQPRISVLLPVYNSNPRWLRRAIDSVRNQLYPNWELCAVDDASTDRRVWQLLQNYARRDPRIKVMRRSHNGHISAASNDALRMTTGDFIALLDHDDELARTALYFAALELNRTPSLQLIYTDEDKLDQQGKRCDPYFKPDWNPDLFTSQNYVSHLSLYAANVVRNAGGFREGLEGSQDYDLTLRCLEQIAPAQIRHIPHVLYHWRIAEQSTATFAAAKPYAREAAITAVQEHLDRTNVPARATMHYGDYLRIVYPPPAGQPLVSIIIPTRDRLSLLRQCIEGIEGKTDYPNVELIVVDNESAEPATLDYLLELEKDHRATVLHVAGEFNFSRLNNIGVGRARGEFVALLNNDLEVINRDWLTEMVAQAARPEIGAVGARLWYSDGRMQHGGVILGVGGVATHAHIGIRKEHGYFARAHLVQNFSAVTAACMVLRKSVYERLGGLNEMNLAVAFNDVDFCLRLREAGLRTVWTPHAELVHHESASRGLEDTGLKQRRFLAEVDYMGRKWGAVLEADPFYNPNLSIESNEQFKLAFPPRVQKPWNES